MVPSGIWEVTMGVIDHGMDGLTAILELEQVLPRVVISAQTACLVLLNLGSTHN